MLTRSPRIFSRRPRLEAVSPLPRLEATPPVTKTCLVRTGRGVNADVAKLAPVVSADGCCPSVHGVSEYQERAQLTCTDTETGPASGGQLAWRAPLTMVRTSSWPGGDGADDDNPGRRLDRRRGGDRRTRLDQPGQGLRVEPAAARGQRGPAGSRRRGADAR